METETRARGIVARGTVGRMRENTCGRFVARHRARHRARVRSASVSPPHRPTASRLKNLNGRAMEFLVDF